MPGPRAGLASVFIEMSAAGDAANQAFPSSFSFLTNNFQCVIDWQVAIMCHNGSHEVCLGMDTMVFNVSFDCKALEQTLWIYVLCAQLVALAGRVLSLPLPRPKRLLQSEVAFALPLQLQVLCVQVAQRS